MISLRTILKNFHLDQWFSQWNAITHVSILASSLRVCIHAVPAQVHVAVHAVHAVHAVSIHVRHASPDAHIDCFYMQVSILFFFCK